MAIVDTSGVHKTPIHTLQILAVWEIWVQIPPPPDLEQELKHGFNISQKTCQPWTTILG